MSGHGRRHSRKCLPLPTGSDHRAARQWHRFRQSETATPDTAIVGDPGDNEVLVVATMPDGGEERSAPVTLPSDSSRVQRRGSPPGSTGNERSSTARRVGERLRRRAIKIWSVAPRDENPAPLDLTEATPGSWSGSVPAADGEYYASLTVEDDPGTHRLRRQLFRRRGRTGHVPAAIHERAAWIADAVVQGRSPQLRSSGVQRGRGAAGRPDGPGCHRAVVRPHHAPCPIISATRSPIISTCRQVRYEEDFRALVEAAHSRDIRVLMDFVPNHTSIEHPYARDAAANGEASTYWDYYDRDSGGNLTHYFNWAHLPNLNYDNPEVARFMMEAFSYWVRSSTSMASASMPSGASSSATPSG